MANNYADTTGLITFKNITPILKAIFSGFEFSDTKSPAYVAYISESTCASWDDIGEALRQIAEEIKLAADEAYSEDENLADPEEDDDEDFAPEIEETLYALAEHYNPNSEELIAFIEGVDFDDTVSFDDAFTLACLLDDGHGLESISLETGFHCSRPRLYEFGVSNYFKSNLLEFYESTNSLREFSESMHSSLACRDVSKAASNVAKQVSKMVSSIFDGDTRAEVMFLTRQMLEVDKSIALEHYAIVGRLPDQTASVCLTLAARSKDEAIALFSEKVWDGISPQDRQALIAQHGVDVVIDHVLKSPYEISLAQA